MNYVIIHHTDADGFCAAALIKNEYVTFVDKCTLYPYNYKGPVDVNIEKGDKVFFVDVSLNQFVLEKIDKCIDNECDVTFIDHHKNSVEYFSEHPEYNDYIHILYADETDERGPVSGCLLSHIFCSMTEEERKHPNECVIELDHEGHYKLQNDDNRIYQIPYIVRLINDRDVFINNIPEAKLFTKAYYKLPKQYKDIMNPDSIWSAIYDDRHPLISKCISDGKQLKAVEDAINASNLEAHGFTTDVFGNDCLCLASYGNSEVFGENINEHDMVCLLEYDGRNSCYTYSIYSKADGIDVSEIAKQYGGGGHIHASGFTLTYNLFDKKVEPEKKEKGIKAFFKRLFNK